MGGGQIESAHFGVLVLPSYSINRVILFGNPPATITCGNPPLKTINCFEFVELKAFVMISLHCNVV